jgi:hypothetical protein
MKKQLIPYGIILTLLVINLSGCTSNTSVNFKKFTSTQGDFSVMMPDTPLENTKTIDSTLGPLKLYSFANEKDNVAYIVMYSDYPRSGLVNYTANKILDNVRNGGVASSSGVLDYELLISKNGYPGREIKISNSNMVIINRFYLVENRLYQVMISTLPDNANLKTNGEFLDSFIVLSKTNTVSDLGWSDSIFEVGMNPPPGWSIDQNQTQGQGLVTFYSQDFNQSIWVAWINTTNLTVGGFSQNLIDIYRRDLTNFYLVSNNTRTIDGKDACEFVYTYSSSTGFNEARNKEKGVVIDYNNGEGILYLLYSAPLTSYTTSLNDFEATLSSLKTL